MKLTSYGPSFVTVDDYRFLRRDVRDGAEVQCKDPNPHTWCVTLFTLSLGFMYDTCSLRACAQQRTTVPRHCATSRAGAAMHYHGFMIV